MKKSVLINTTLSLILTSAMVGQARADLPPNAILQFDAGHRECLLGGTPPYACNFGITTVHGSNFGIDAGGGNYISDNEKTPISPNSGVMLGTVQPASGSHSGYPNGSENPGIDAPWAFFGNTGMHLTNAPITIISDDGAGHVQLDMSGWGVTWNGIPFIPVGGDPANFAGDDGIGIVNCSVDCSHGDNFTLTFESHVPSSDPSGFGGIFYRLYLEGTVGGTPPVTTYANIQLTGDNPVECSSHEGSLVQATANIITSDMNDILSLSWYLDDDFVTSGNSFESMVALGTHDLRLVVETQDSGTFQPSESIIVQDNTAPELNILFFDQHTGNQITQVSDSGLRHVTVNYDVSDTCDPQPSTSNGVITPVNVVHDGATIEIMNGVMETSAIKVSANAIDGSGNAIHSESRLLIAD